jgi:hypothetical protein
LQRRKGGSNRLDREAGQTGCRQDVLIAGPPRSPREVCKQRLDLVVLDGMGRKPAVKHVCSGQSGAGEPEIASDLPGTAVEKPRGPDVGKEPDPGLRHRKKSAFRRNAVGPVDRDPGPAAHRDPIDDRDIGLEKPLDLPDQMVFLAKEHRGQVRVTTDTPSRFVNRAHIAAGAERPVAGAADDDGMHRRVRRPCTQGRLEPPVVVEGQRIERLWPVDRQGRESAFAAEEDLVGIVHQLPSRRRAMMTRMISLVPSRIWWTRTSRR